MNAELVFDRRDLYRNFLLIIPGFTGVNQTVSPYLIQDSECRQIWNFLPSAPATLRKIKSRLKLANTQYPVRKMFTTLLNNYYRGLVFLQNGSVHRWDGTNLTQIATGLTGIDSDCTVWQKSVIYVIDPTGYYKWNGTTWSQVSNQIRGTSIVTWQGRVFISWGSIVKYSVPGDPEDFAGTGSGYFDLAEAFPSLRFQVKKIVPYVDSILFYGDTGAVALTGSTISNDPSQWYMTSVSDTAGCQNEHNVVTYDNRSYLQNKDGLFIRTISQQQKFDYKILLSENHFFNGPAAVRRINNFLFYLIPVSNFSPIRGPSLNVMAFCIDLNEFYFLDFGVDVYGLYNSFIEGVEDRLYILGPDGLYAAFEGNDPVTGYIETKIFTLNNPVVEKYWWYCLLKKRKIEDPGNRQAKRLELDQREETIMPIRYSGTELSLTIRDDEPGVYELSGMVIKGQFTRSVL